MHGGDFNNQTEGKLIDRNQYLKQANQQRIVKNEWAGIGKAAVLSLRIGFALGFIAELAQAGVSGVESAALDVLNHVIVRGITNLAQNSVQGKEFFKI